MAAAVVVNLKKKMTCRAGGFTFEYVRNLHFHFHFHTGEVALPVSTLGCTALCSSDPTRSQFGFLSPEREAEPLSCQDPTVTAEAACSAANQVSGGCTAGFSGVPHLWVPDQVAQVTSKVLSAQEF